jgi:hypothetical protein
VLRRAEAWRAGYLATRYDEPGDRPTPLPAVLSSGKDPALQLADGFVRGRRMLGRCRTSPVALGIKMGPVAGPLRFTIEFILDKITPEWSAEHAAPTTPSPTSGPDERGEQPRLLLIHAQRRLRGAIVLRSHPEHRPVRAEISLELAAAEIPADGLVLLEIWGYREWPAAAAQPAQRHDLAPFGAVGVGITTLTVSPASFRTSHPYGSSAEPATVATMDGGLLVVNAASGPTRITLTSSTQSARRTARTARRAAGRAARMMRRAARKMRRARAGAGPGAGPGAEPRFDGVRVESEPMERPRR